MQNVKCWSTPRTMKYSTYDMLSLIFKICCITVAVSMAGFWVYKYQKDDNVSVVEYKYLRLTDDAVYPETSICILNPFLGDKFENHHNNVSIEEYLDFLSGAGDFDERYRDVDFLDVTLNLFDYLSHVRLLESDGSFERHDCTIRTNCPFLSYTNNFNGFILDFFYRCFSINIVNSFKKRILGIAVFFKPKLEHTLMEMKKTASGKYHFKVALEFASPNQYLRAYYYDDPIWKEQPMQGTIEMVSLRAIEVYKRRNKRQDPCIEDWLHYDELVLSKHISSSDCDTPYQNHSGPLCTTRSKMMSVKYEVTAVKEKYFPPPCQEITDVKYKLQTSQYFNSTTLGIVIFYPSLMKQISQTQYVDAHTLIGNIGGYIGLFLGKVGKILFMEIIDIKLHGNIPSYD